MPWDYYAPRLLGAIGENKFSFFPKKFFSKKFFSKKLFFNTVESFLRAEDSSRGKFLYMIVTTCCKNRKNNV